MTSFFHSPSRHFGRFITSMMPETPHLRLFTPKTIQNFIRSSLTNEPSYFPRAVPAQWKTFSTT
ncbi:hypothetical protein CLU79DRAFT_770053 [Phycomyces nitens]|nr:hypothetical protein CLU79DRAFT_770053 [Phycomyces nitens]